MAHQSVSFTAKSTRPKSGQNRINPSFYLLTINRRERDEPARANYTRLLFEFHAAPDADRNKCVARVRFANSRYNSLFHYRFGS